MAFHHLSNGTLCLVHLVFHRRSSGTLRPAHMAFHPRNRMASRRIICLHCSQAAHHFSRATRPAYQAYLFLPLHKQAPSHRIDKWNFRRRLPAINRPYSHLHMAQTRLNKAKRPQGRSQLRFAYAPCRGVARRCRPSRLNLSSPTPPQDTREGYPYHGRMVLPFPDLCAILWQAPASLWSDEGRTSPLTEVTLRFGQELVVRSSNTTPRSLLLISPAT